MKNAYHRDIVDILLPLGSEGMSLRTISRIVYNRHAGLFAHDVDFTILYRSIAYYLWHESNQPGSAFIRGKQRGWYAINPNLGVQLDICFDTETTEVLPLTNAESEELPSLFSDDDFI